MSKLPKVIYFNSNNQAWAVCDDQIKGLAEKILTEDTIEVSNEGVIHEVRKLILQDKIKHDELVLQWIREDLDRMDVMYFEEDSLIRNWPLELCSKHMMNARDILKLMVYKRNPKLKSKSE